MISVGEERPDSLNETKARVTQQAIEYSLRILQEDIEN